ncbi:hypothetical protein [Bradyrhizobium sp.]
MLRRPKRGSPMLFKSISRKLLPELDRIRTSVARPWSDLRGISNSYAAKSTIVIPLIGYYILFNEYLVKWSHLAQQVGGSTPADHIPRRALWLYMGLCSIAIGTFIYALRCPPEVKKYGDFKDYVNGDGPALTDVVMEEIEKTLGKAGYDTFTYRLNKERLAMHFDYLNNLHPYSRIAVTLCFAAGFLILGILSAQVFFRVLLRLVGL